MKTIIVTLNYFKYGILNIIVIIFAPMEIILDSMIIIIPKILNINNEKVMKTF